MTSEPRSHTRDNVSAGQNGARRLAFAGFVRRALETARTSRAWNGSEVARRTGVSRQTINRWVRADWHSDPEPERVVAFCEGLGLSPAAAFALLEWARPADQTPEPAPALDPDIAALVRRLADPTLTEQELFHIRETVRYLAHRTPLSADRRTA
jgi:transcriptional regulator with XRE-family HTH domain